ncbi:hypothetical protein, partial [Oricola indica]|uniref:hypothetical protein n=1 Tax=Oricola indica TaxID=2872591 RepID=UPI001CC09C42
YLFVVLLMMLHPTQELEPPANPGRFNHREKSTVTHLHLRICGCHINDVPALEGFTVPSNFSRNDEKRFLSWRNKPILPD